MAPKKPLFATGWYKTAPVDELRKEVTQLYQEIEALESSVGVVQADVDSISVVWGGIDGTLSDQTDLQDALDLKSNVGHTHDDRYYTETEVDTLLTGYSATGHTHDDRYYTESEVDTLLSAKAPLANPSFTGTLYAPTLHGSTGGTAFNPTFSFSGDPNTGMYNSSANTIGFTAGNINMMSLISSGISMQLNGTQGTPSISWGADPDTGIYRAGTNLLGLSVGGNAAVEIGPTAINLYRPINPQVRSLGEVTAISSGGGTSVLPAGVFMFYRATRAGTSTTLALANITLEIQESGTWYSVGAIAGMGAVFSDGTNVRLVNTDATYNADVHYVKT